MGNAVTNPGRFIEKKVFHVPRSNSAFVNDRSGDDALRRAEEARQRAEMEAQRRADQLKQEMEARRRAEEAQRNAEREAQRRAELLRQQEEARRRAEQARRNAEREAQRRAEELQVQRQQQREQLSRSKSTLTAQLQEKESEYVQAHNKVVAIATQIAMEEKEIESFRVEREDNSTKIIITLGMTGGGKSTLCNRLKGDESQFGNQGGRPTSGTGSSCTQNNAKVAVEVGGHQMTVVDTPGFGDSYGRDRYEIFSLHFHIDRYCNVIIFGIWIQSVSTSVFESLWKHLVLNGGSGSVSSLVCIIQVQSQNLAPPLCKINSRLHTADSNLKTLKIIEHIHFATSLETTF